MAMKAEMTSSALVELLGSFDAAGIPVWLDGGWGADRTMTSTSSSVSRTSRSFRRPWGAEGSRFAKVHHRNRTFSPTVPGSRSTSTQSSSIATEAECPEWRMERTGSSAEAFGGRGVVEGMTVRCLHLRPKCSVTVSVRAERERSPRHGALAQPFPIEPPPQLRRSRE
jgi:hypothetical protein